MFKPALIITIIVLLAVLGSLPSPVGLAHQTVQGQEPGEDGPSILRLSLITAGAIMGAGVLGLVLNFLRQRIGYTPHQPLERQRDQVGSSPLNH